MELATQQRHLPQEALLNNFLDGLTQEFGQQCMLQKVTTFLAAQETCRAIHFATAATTAGSFQTAGRSFGRRSPSSQRMRPTSPFSRQRLPFRSASPFRRTQDRNPFSSPRRSQSPSARASACFQCGQQGHFRKDCTQRSRRLQVPAQSGSQAPVTRSTQRNDHPPGRGDGRWRGRPQGNVRR